MAGYAQLTEDFRLLDAGYDIVCGRSRHRYWQ
jgi:hypothetical protein